MRTNSRITVNCSQEQHDQLKLEAERLNISLSSYLLDRGLEEDLSIPSQAQVQLAKLYSELFHLNQKFQSQTSQESANQTEMVQDAITLLHQLRQTLVEVSGQLTGATENADQGRS